MLDTANKSVNIPDPFVISIGVTTSTTVLGILFWIKYSLIKCHKEMLQVVSMIIIEIY